MNPIFTKGHLSFAIDGDTLEFPHENIAVSGATGLPWGKQNPADCFGKEIMASIRILSGEPFGLKAAARITREITLHAQHMGVTFYLDDEQRERLARHIKQHGYFPTEYIRKYPRIPSLPMIQSFPTRALISLKDEGVEGFPMSCDVENLSPNGVLICTENQAILNFVPGAKVDIVLEPRGWFPLPIKAQGMVCRTTDELSRLNGNLVRHLGIKFSRVDDVNRTAFVDLLRDILERFKDLA